MPRKFIEENLVKTEVQIMCSALVNPQNAFWTHYFSQSYILIRGNMPLRRLLPCEKGQKNKNLKEKEEGEVGVINGPFSTQQV
jgi:hypothetical protein